MKFLVYLALMFPTLSLALIVPSAGDWSIQTWDNQYEVQQLEVSSVGTINWASSTPMTVRTSEAIFYFDLAGISAGDVLAVELSVSGGTSFEQPLQTQVDLFGLFDFSPPPTEQMSRFIGAGTEGTLLMEEAFVASVSYETARYSFAVPSITSFVISELQQGRSNIGFRLSPDSATAPSAFTSSLDVWTGLFEAEYAPQLQVTAVPEPSTYFLLLSGLVVTIWRIKIRTLM